MSLRARTPQRRPSSAPPAPLEGTLPSSERRCLSAPLQPSPTAALHSRKSSSPAAMLPNAADTKSFGTESSTTPPSKSRSAKFLGKLKLPLRGRKEDPQLRAVAYSTESNQLELPEENRRRLIYLFFTGVRVEVIDGTVTRSREHNTKIAWAYFDFNFEEGPGGPFILINESVLSDIPHDGFKAYEDPKNPPFVMLNPDGSKMKLLGEFSTSWSSYGEMTEYTGQQIFLNPCKSIKSRCLVVPEESPYDVLVGLGTIKKHRLNVFVPYAAPISGRGQGQGGKHDGQASINIDAINKKKLLLEADRAAQLLEQRKIEEEMNKAKP